MPTWEDVKRAGQTAYQFTGNMFQDIHSSIGNGYQQILLAGHLYPSMGGQSMTQEIAEGTYDHIEHESPLQPGREQNAPDQETPDQQNDIEPER